MPKFQSALRASQHLILMQNLRNILATCLYSTFLLNEWINNFPFFFISSWICYSGWITKLVSLSQLRESIEILNQCQSFHIFLLTDPLTQLGRNSLCKKCPYLELFWPAFTLNAGKCGPELLRIQTLFLQWDRGNHWSWR